MKLYEISNEYHNALADLSDSDFDQETINDTLEGLKGELEIKAKNVAAFIENRKAEIDAVKVASKRLAERAATEQKSLDRLTDYLKYNMELNGTTEIRSPELVLKIKTNPPSVIIDDEALIADYFIKEKVVKSIDKAAIKKELQAGMTIIGAHIEQKTRLEIK